MSNSNIRYVCPACGSSYEIDMPLWRCVSCMDSHLNLTESPGLSRADIDTSCSSLWRYAAAFCFPIEELVTLGEGWTPLLEKTWDGVTVHMKLEFLAPTGSFKDRGTAVMISYLKSKGVKAILEDSSGNAGASMAAYAAVAGIKCRILVPATAPAGKLMQMAAVGAEVVTIDGSRQDVSEACFSAAKKIFYASHNRQAFFLQGTKTVAYEIWEQLGFRAPDNIVVPVGGGSNVLGCYIGFSELLKNNEIERLPRIFGVQAANCAPLYAAFAAGADDLVSIGSRPTVADGIALPRPIRGREILSALRKTKGGVVAVSEDEIVMALRTLLSGGIFVEPTSAAAAAGLSKLISDARIGKDETTVLILTGTGLKATSEIGNLLGISVKS